MAEITTGEDNATMEGTTPESAVVPPAPEIDPAAHPQVSHLSGFAKVAFICGLLSFIVPSFELLGSKALAIMMSCIGSPISMILAVIADYQIKKSEGRLYGLPMVNTGFILSAVLPIAWIISPHPYQMSRRALESSMQANLQTLRNATEQFHDDTGKYPLLLIDLASPTPPSYVNPNKYHGPYLRAQGGVNGGAIPQNPTVKENLPAETTHLPSATPEAHWSYNAKTGDVHPGNTGKTLDGGLDYQQL